MGVIAIMTRESTGQLSRSLHIQSDRHPPTQSRHEMQNAHRDADHSISMVHPNHP